MGLLDPDEKPKKKSPSGFRPTRAQEDFLERLKTSRKVDYTKTISSGLDLLIEAERRLGGDFRTMEAVAEERGIKFAVILIEAAKRGWPDLRDELAKRPL